MRSVRYKVHAGVGADPGRWTFASLSELLFKLAYFLMPSEVVQPIPPRHILNQVFASGKWDCGMSGKWSWKPYEISEAEYEELVEELLTLSGFHLIEDQELWVCRDGSAWQARRLSKYSPRATREKHPR